MTAQEPSRLAPGLHQFCQSVGGFDRTYRVYIPQSLSALGEGVRVPLLVTLHGGDYALAHERTSWHLLAEEKRFLVLYPEALRAGIMWNAWDNLSAADGRPDDVAYLDWLLDTVSAALPVDEARIYLHGQSMGDMMGMHYAFLRPNRIAAAFLCSGPTKTKWWMTPGGEPRFSPAGPCPVMRLHGEEDCFRATGFSPMEAKLYKQQCHVEPNARYWIDINGCEGLPRIATTNQYNALLYDGADGCDFVSLFIKDGVHRPPAEAERFAWETFLTAFRLENGRHVQSEPGRRIAPDARAIAAAAGTADLLVGNERVHADAQPALSLDGVLYADVAALSALSERLGLSLALSRESLRVGETDLLPFCRTMEENGYRAHGLFDAAYAAQQPMRLTFDLAYAIRSLLDVQQQLSSRDAFLLEDRIYRRQCRDAGFAAPTSREEEIWQWGHTV